MNTVFYYYVLGPLILCATYALCFFLILGIKVFSFFFIPKRVKPKKSIPPPCAKTPREKKRSTVKSIEIDPDYVDKIYVKKSS